MKDLLDQGVRVYDKTFSSSSREISILKVPFTPLISRRRPSISSSLVNFPKLPSIISLSPAPSGIETRFTCSFEVNSILKERVDSLFILILSFHLLLETAIAMILLSRMLPYRTNRWANIIVGTLHTVSVSASMFAGTGPGLYYLFFGTIEITCTAYIVWSAWKWSNPERADALHSQRT